VITSAPYRENSFPQKADAMSEDKEMLEDLIISALNKALSKSKSDSQEKMNSIAGGMMGGMKIPGL